MLGALNEPLLILILPFQYSLYLYNLLKEFYLRLMELSLGKPSKSEVGD